MNDTLRPIRSILIVDDDSDVLVALSETLAGGAHRLVCCSNGPEALDAISKEPFAVVISDQNMPGMNGLELLERVREAQPFCSRILITGMLLADTLVGAINKGEIYRFVAKPWKRG